MQTFFVHTVNNQVYNYLGQFTLPVSCLIKPGPTRQIREPDATFIECLKREMLLNPTLDVAPIVALVILSDGEEFNSAHAEGYQYETIG